MLDFLLPNLIIFHADAGETDIKVAMRSCAELCLHHETDEIAYRDFLRNAKKFEKLKVLDQQLVVDQLIHYNWIKAAPEARKSFKGNITRFLINPNAKIVMAEYKAQDAERRRLEAEAINAAKAEYRAMAED